MLVPAPVLVLALQLEHDHDSQGEVLNSAVLAAVVESNLEVVLVQSKQNQIVSLGFVVVPVVLALLVAVERREVYEERMRRKGQQQQELSELIQEDLKCDEEKERQ